MPRYVGGDCGRASSTRIGSISNRQGALNKLHVPVSSSLRSGRACVKSDRGRRPRWRSHPPVAGVVPGDPRRQILRAPSASQPRKLLSGRSLHIPQECLSNGLLRLRLLPLPQHRNLPFQLLGVFYNGQSYQPTTRSHLSSRVVLGTCCSTKHYAIPRSANDERRRFRCSSQETPM